MIQTLNEAGREGWEVIEYNADVGNFICKRPTR
jgi:hypothetical protein